jgi:ParB family chromosome partitioning protein
VLGGIESSTSKNTWRHPEATYARYFEQIAAWGYGLSEVEQIVIDAKTGTTAVAPVDEEPRDDFDADELADELIDE